MKEENELLPAAAFIRTPCKCSIVGPAGVKKLVLKYLGLSRENITRNEIEILLFALYNESCERGGLAAEATAIGDEKLRAQGASDDATPQAKAE